MDQMLFEVGDFIQIDDFPLKWRWTEERYAKLSAEDLAMIRPLRREKASEMWEKFGAQPRELSGVAEIFEGVPPESDDYAAAVRLCLARQIPLLRETCSCSGIPTSQSS